MRLPVIASIALAAVLSMGISAPAHAEPASSPPAAASDAQVSALSAPAAASASAPVPLAQTASTTTPTTTVVSAPATAALGTTIVLKASVSGGNPTGIVAFLDDNVLVGTTSLNTGEATITTTVSAAGSRKLTAVYLGDTNHASSNSAQIVMTVPKAASTTTIISAAASMTAGQAAWVSLEVTGRNPNGTVELRSGSTVVGSFTLDTGPNTVLVSFGISTRIPTAGTHDITAHYLGDGNNTPSATPPVTIEVGKATSNTTLTTSSSNPTVGSTVTFLATVSGSNVSGDVEFFDGTTLLGTRPISNGAARFITSTLAPGARTVTARYVGDANNNASSQAKPVTIAKATSTTTLTSSGNATVGSPVTFTANVTGHNIGQVTFFNGSTTLAEVPVHSGVATFTTSELSVGVHSITASYATDVNNIGSSSAPITTTISKAASTTTLTSSGNTVVGSDVTFTASVTGRNVGGNVEFFNGTTSLGTKAITNGVATLTTSALPAGSYSVTAVYAGDANNTGSPSAATTVTIEPQSTSVTLDSKTVDTPLGTVAVLTATVTISGGIARIPFARGMARAAVLPGAPSGLVEFFNNGISLGTAPLNGAGVATLTTAVLAPGAHSFTAKYAGSTSSSSSTSTATPITVAQPTPPATPKPAAAAALPSTGSTPLPGAIAAFLLLALGGVTLLVHRRKGRATQ